METCEVSAAMIASVSSRHLKNSGSCNRIRTHDRFEAGGRLHKLSYEARTGEHQFNLLGLCVPVKGLDKSQCIYS